jgi:hypothetical protein
MQATYSDPMSQEEAVRIFASVLQAEGLHAGLAFLNSRTPHRCTAVYKYAGQVMLNVLVFDRMDPENRSGIDVAAEDAYCAQVSRRGKAFEFRDTALLARGEQRPGNPVVCYCGVVIPDPKGAAWGTLCHYDFKPCEMRKSDIPLLEAVSRLVYDHAIQELARRVPAVEVRAGGLPSSAG